MSTPREQMQAVRAAIDTMRKRRDALADNGRALTAAEAQELAKIIVAMAGGERLLAAVEAEENALCPYCRERFHASPVIRETHLVSCSQWAEADAKRRRAESEQANRF